MASETTRSCAGLAWPLVAITRNSFIPSSSRGGRVSSSICTSSHVCGGKDGPELPQAASSVASSSTEPRFQNLMLGMIFKVADQTFQIRFVDFAEAASDAMALHAQYDISPFLHLMARGGRDEMAVGAPLLLLRCCFVGGGFVVCCGCAVFLLLFFVCGVC